MRVALVGPYPFRPERVEGGVEASVAALASALARRPDVDPHVITFVPGLAEPKRTVVDGLPVLYLPAPRRLRSLTFHIRERRALARALAYLRPEVIHAQDTLQYGFICLKTGGPVPVVVSIHGIARASHQLAPSPVVRLRNAVTLTALERYCVRNARYLTQPTRYPETYFDGEIRGRIWDVGNPIADRFFSIDPAPEPGRILFAGSVIPLKRVLDLVEAMPTVSAAVPSARLCIAGDDRTPYADLLRSRAIELGQEQRVVMVGACSPDELADEYRRASVFVLASGQETSPMVVGEAMAASVPVVATRVGGVPFLVEEGATGHLVEVGDIGSLAAGVVDMLRDPARATRYGSAGRAKAEREFRADAVAERVRWVYVEAASARDGG
jgi:glycosyltransferase involved in cell wall biosynthesis